MRKMSMWKRLFFSYFIFILFFGVVISININEFGKLHKSVTAIERQYNLSDIIDDMSHGALAEENAVYEFFIGRNQLSLDTYHSNHLKIQKDIIKLQGLREQFPTLVSEIDIITQSLQEQNEIIEKSIKAITIGQTDEARSLLLEVSDHNDKMVQPMLNDLAEKSEMATYSLLEVLNKLKSTIITLFSLLGLAVLMGLTLGYVLAKRYTDPIKKLTEATEKDESGNYKTIEGVFPNDEVGILASAFNNMVRVINKERRSLKEQNQQLRSHQEELSAQNEEIAAQQEELAATLELVNSKRIELTKLNEFNYVLNQSIELNDLAGNILQFCLRNFQAEAGAVLLKSEDGNDINITASAGFNAKSDDKIHFDSLKGLAKRCLLGNECICISYPETDYYAGVKLNQSRKLMHEIYIPITFNNRTLGLLILGRLSGDPISDKETSLLNALMKQAAIAINNALYCHQVEKMYDDLLGQASLVEELNAQLEVERDNIKRAQEITRAVIESMNEAIAMVDMDNQVVAVNKRWNQLFQDSGDLSDITADHLFSASFEQLKNVDEVHKNLQKIIAAPMNYGEFNAIQEDRVLQVWTGPVRDKSDDVIGRLFVFRDITKEAEIDRMKSEFVSTVSHELRTPLSSILGFSELLLIKKIDEKVRSKYIKTIHKEAQRLTNLVNDFLDLQRMESGKQVYNMEDIPVRALLSDVIDTFSCSGYPHPVKVELTSDLVLKADRDRITQVLINLLSNAAKFSPDAGEITTGAAVDGEFVRFFVRDRGLGIPMEVQSKLFSKFYRVDNSDRRKIGGTGLGLAICKEIVEAHGGRIWVESKHGEGSTFFFTVKMANLMPENHERSSEPEVVPSPIQHTFKKVLLVEDDHSLSLLFKDHMESAGYLVEVRATGEEALESVKQFRPDVVILDILLAGKLNGWSVLHTLKGHPDTEKIPIIISSCLPEKEIGMAMGVSEYLVKPFEPQILVNIVGGL